MKIFSTEPGAVQRVADPQASGTTGVVTVPGLGSAKIAVTRVTVREQANFQFLHTLGNFIYVYVFGDRVGHLGISGLAFHQACGFEGGTIGVEDVMQFYRENKISKRASPLKVTIGTSLTMEVFLLGAHYDVVDPQNKICQFDLTFAQLPQE